MVASPPDSYIRFLFSYFSNACHFACVSPTALKHSRMTKFGMLFLTMASLLRLTKIYLY